ncbi:MAG TPA: monovalent cation:proton antiporter-2 (CPA2) family protein [Xanthobacteraceae bacterium]|jgi:monovalent cation:proton antiporter-2 (CPA2) family protein|nr:monovalent cation:proton antiporter-2 (CPA2) family protein [Xanthobacteraceae bacterium]
MNSHPTDFGFLSFGLVLLGACVVSVPIARRLRLSAIVAYLAAGAIIGPWGIGVIRAPSTILAVAELGVVLMMFVIGLELALSRLLAMRRAIFGLGAAQLALTAALLGGLAAATGLADWRGSVVAGLAFALSATAIALEILEERGDLHLTYGQRAFAILLFQDMAVVPLIALLPLIAPGGGEHADFAGAATSAALVGVAIAALVLAGRYLLNPFFRLLSETGAREVMTAAALLVVLGAALLMQAVGMSMALGAFLAGVLLAESNYRHELEADIEPFRGLLLALFFMGVGMTIDLDVVRAHLRLIIAAALAITVIKAVIVWGLYRTTCVQRGDALRAGSVLTGAGEFAFVLFPLGVSLGIITRNQQSLFTAVAAVTMLLGPAVAALGDAAIRRFVRADEPEPESFDGVSGSVLVIGFGRFGQIVSQCLVAEGVDVTAIDVSAGMIQNASRFGFKVYYGDGTRLDVLRAAGAGAARLIAVCVDDRRAATRIVEMARTEFPGVKLYVRSYDRVHTLELIDKGVDFELRETYESALVFGRHALEAIGLDPERAREVEEEVRRRDLDRLALQQAGDIYAGADLMPYGTLPHEPLSAPKRKAVPLNPEAADVIKQDTEVSG